MRSKPPHHHLILLLHFSLFSSISAQLSCHRIPTSFCCTTRIRDQCPEQCATVQCGSEFIHSLFSTDNSGSGRPRPSGGAHDGSAQIGAGNQNSQNFAGRNDGFTGQNQFNESPEETIIAQKPDESVPAAPVAPAPAPTPSELPQLPPQEQWSFGANSGDASAPKIAPTTTPSSSSSGFPTLIPFSSEANLWSSVTPLQTLPPPPPAPRRDGHRRRTTPDPRIIRPPESLVVIGDYDEDEPPSENAVVDSPQPTPPPATFAPTISNSGDVFARSRKEISSFPGKEQEKEQEQSFVNSGTASALSGSSHEWKVSIIPRGKAKTPDVNSIPPLTIDGKSDERFNKFYRTIDKVINKLELTPNGGLHVREGEPQIRLEGSTKDLNIESSAVVSVGRTTVAPGTTNKVSVIPFRPLRFTAPPKNGPPAAQPAPRAPAPSPSAPRAPPQCGTAPDFTPCVSNEIASKSLLECCRRKNLPAGCQQLCRYDITQQEIRAAMDRGQCGIFNVAPFLECASQGKDNSECCRHRGIVQKTGPQCEQFCRPSQGLTSLGVQHIVCGNAVGDMLHCHHSGVRI